MYFLILILLIMQVVLAFGSTLCTAVHNRLPCSVSCIE